DGSLQRRVALTGGGVHHPAERSRPGEGQGRARLGFLAGRGERAAVARARRARAIRDRDGARVLRIDRLARASIAALCERRAGQVPRRIQIAVRIAATSVSLSKFTLIFRAPRPATADAPRRRPLAGRLPRRWTPEAPVVRRTGAGS